MKTLNKIIKGIKIIAGFSVLYPLALLGTQGISQETSPKINNPIRLEQILGIEKKRAGIKEDIIINAQIREKEEISYAIKIREKEYKIRLSGNSSLSTLRHELYHVADGHCDTEYNLLRYFFIQEPRAEIYALTGLKL